MIWLSAAGFAVVAFQWFFWGYSLAFSETGGAFMGNLAHFGFIGVLEQPSPVSNAIPRIVFALYQLTVRLAPSSSLLADLHSVRYHHTRHCHWCCR